MRFFRNRRDWMMAGLVFGVVLTTSASCLRFGRSQRYFPTVVNGESDVFDVRVRRTKYWDESGEQWRWESIGEDYKYYQIFFDHELVSEFKADDERYEDFFVIEGSLFSRKVDISNGVRRRIFLVKFDREGVQQVCAEVTDYETKNMMLRLEYVNREGVGVISILNETDDVEYIEVPLISCGIN